MAGDAKHLRPWQFKPGNRAYPFGQKRLYETPEALWEACRGYFDWCEANPLIEDEIISFQGEATHVPVSKMRAMTLDGLCIHIHMAGRTTWDLYRRREGFEDVTALVDSIIRDQKFTGAAAGLLNPVIIARDLGLTEKTELTGKDGQPVQVERIERVIVDPKNTDG